MKKDISFIFICIFIVIVSFFIENNILKTSFLAISYIIIGYDVLLNGIKTLTKKSFLDENFLMSIASLGAFFIGEQLEAVGVMLFYKIGATFERYSLNKSRNSLKDAMKLMPEYANLKLDNGEHKKVDPNSINIGDIILIKPGEKVPIDGIIISGNSSLNTAAITGEPIPKELKTGDEITSGYVNINGLLEVKVTKNFESSTIAQILELVEDATTKKSKQEKFITKFARVYTPIVVFVAIFITIIPPFFTGEIKEWFYRALIFLVVSCPCALVISVPLSFFGGIGASSKKGILVKGSNFLDVLSKAKTFVFDKTGTLTKGEFMVDEVVSVGKFSKDDVIEFAALSQLYSSHPIGISLIKYTKSLNINLDENLVSNLEEIPGFGIKADIKGSSVLIGNANLLKNFALPKLDKTSTFIAINGEFAGYITFKDEIRYDAITTIKYLKSKKIKTFMLTGDKENSAKLIATKLGIDHVFAELTPMKKVEILESLMDNKAKNETICYIGDGINDAPVLARADVGIAIFGSSAAIEAGDIVLLDSSLNKLKTALQISKKTINIAYENIIFSIGIKIFVLILAIFGFASMWAAIFADVGVTILAILNSFRVFAYAKKI
ncbi:MAG: heavy metal translocating P-type ATPase [Campylobacter sputorum]|uniref:heavy metal translocating P-type ATPase n=1 Tax=Campylobacter sputorum TaxID=206 RepID=UPI000B782E90|nr:heavy metal translocating P-type ATPase [Campylobacter sputorum]ASM37776.1 heavy metal translocating P-type ATPase [Campylobacter sputorum bv. paraureolyticus LMG 11764]MDY6119926.1 heavy metal translocating P-type ATPase [Campylobacter sputorum]